MGPGGGVSPSISNAHGGGTEGVRNVSGPVRPPAAEEAVEKITRSPSSARRWSYKERRKELLLALLDDHADSLDSAVDELGRWVDHLRQVGIRGFIAEHTNDADFARAARMRTRRPPRGSEDEAARHERSGGRRRTTSTSRRERSS